MISDVPPAEYTKLYSRVTFRNAPILPQSAMHSPTFPPLGSLTLPSALEMPTAFTSRRSTPMEVLETIRFTSTSSAKVPALG